MAKKCKRTQESSLSTKHKALLKTFLKDLINDLADGKLNREDLINKVNQKFKDYNLKQIYTKTKLSNSIANYRYSAKHLKNRNLNIKIPESSFKKKLVKQKVVKQEAVKEEPKTPIPDNKESVNISHIEFYLGHDIPDMLFQEVINCKELPIFE